GYGSPDGRGRLGRDRPWHGQAQGRNRRGGRGDRAPPRPAGGAGARDRRAQAAGGPGGLRAGQGAAGPRPGRLARRRRLPQAWLGGGLSRDHLDERLPGDAPEGGVPRSRGHLHPRGGPPLVRHEHRAPAPDDGRRGLRQGGAGGGRARRRPGRELYGGGRHPHPRRADEQPAQGLRRGLPGRLPEPDLRRGLTRGRLPRPLAPDGPGPGGDVAQAGAPRRPPGRGRVHGRGGAAGGVRAGGGGGGERLGGRGPRAAGAGAQRPGGEDEHDALYRARPVVGGQDRAGQDERGLLGKGQARGAERRALGVRGAGDQPYSHREPPEPQARLDVRVLRGLQGPPRRGAGAARARRARGALPLRQPDRSLPGGRAGRLV
ncbi:MAG: Chorismate mutase I / Prephenate dehydratase, partial [uncultured Rubrobacteraceae bacterium]